ncbi:conserved hypothetical protein [Trichinella spiralis]|uniref:hypothetical protein n=1 Tax=Trichinella spiralis TaxID=6334 RepID=UPI0001EFD704|nr:conserved hypothetical protein [Trichinella spiralis]
MAEIGFERFETLAYWWETTPRVWFVLVDEVDILSRHLEEEGKKPYEPSGPFMTSTETRSLRMGIAASDANYNISSVISAPHIKCIAAATSFIKVSRGNTVAVFVDSSLKSILKRLGLKETRPMDPRTASPRAIAENKQEDEN